MGMKEGRKEAGSIMSTLQIDQTKVAIYERALENMRLGLVPPGDPNLLNDETMAVPIQDLYMIFRIHPHEDDRAIASSVVTKKLLKHWGISEAKLLTDAMREVPKNNPPRIMRVDDLLKDMGVAVEHNQGLGLFCLSTQSFANGAAVITYPGFLKHVSAQLGSIFIIPSSKHEVLAIPQKTRELKFLKQLVKMVNKDIVEEKDFLSDNIYSYRIGDSTFRLETRVYGDAWE